MHDCHAFTRSPVHLIDANWSHQYAKSGEVRRRAHRVGFPGEEPISLLHEKTQNDHGKLDDRNRSVVFGLGLALADQVLAGLGELTLLHTLADIPVDEGALGIHEVELVVETGPGLCDGGGVGQHADSALNFSHIATGHGSRGLVVDSDLEASRAPIDELNGALGLDGSDSGAGVLGDDVAAI
ncbi:hypothetical protein BC936DRAFT_138638 [Jimgerdemannia flammicorona]|uniref:Uncharacterized protein n=2 Tax=Jimgerdemannia flammicorona TaxID=994334 RepID=A0A433QT10_9FUNG|nr:hypothetical protein BC936DRAFT_138638 [Jimgerdemannia flammicorona]RUS32924.1 hypothetical protein BC938DRAFT_473761 [Jimgerdemannia flammicorona]